MKKRSVKLNTMLLATAMLLLTACGDAQQPDAESTYAEKLFDTGYVHEINIEISEEDWADLLDNPTDKTKYKANVTIDGEEVSDVSFATKGNTSLSSIARDENTDRYSFKINFGKYVDDQTYYGLDKLNLNNIYADATYIKDYLSYQLFNHMGVDAPLSSFANITINGEPWGLYLAVEDVSDSFLERTDNSSGQLYKPETSMMAGGFDAGRMKDFDPEKIKEYFSEDKESADNTERNHGQGRGGFGRGFGGMDQGASLKYTDDKPESYSDIFDNAETKPTEEDEARLVEALKKLSEGDAEGSLKIDSIINYFVVHNFVVNYDSYTGNMLHNYYLYEEDGKMQMIPWDYNLAFGGFTNMGGGFGRNRENRENSTNSTETVNYGIDSPLLGAEEADRPMWSWIVRSDEYLEEYHRAFDELTTYVLSDEFSKELDRLYEMLYPYVENDPTAFYTAEEFTKGFDTIREFVSLRAESIKKQLSGELSTDTNEQNEADRIDASDIAISDMGSQRNFTIVH